MMKTFPHKPPNPFIQLDLHDGLFITPPSPIPVVAKSMHLSGGALLLPGTKKENEQKLFANSEFMLSRDHEVKYLIAPHLSVYPLFPPTFNALMPLLIGLSSNKCIFASTTVKGKDGPIAVSVLFGYVGFNQACNDPLNLPTSITFNWGNVNLGFSLGDLVAGLLLIAFDSLVSFVMGELFGLLKKVIPKGLFKNFAKDLLWKLSKSFSKVLKKLNLDKAFKTIKNTDMHGVDFTVYLKKGEKGFKSAAEAVVPETIVKTIKTFYDEVFSSEVSDTLGKIVGNLDPANLGEHPVDSAADSIARWIDSSSETVE